MTDHQTPFANFSLERAIALRWTLRRIDSHEAETGTRLAGAEVARMVVQDLRGPLTTIAGWARLLQDGQVQHDEERRQALLWIAQSATTQKIILDDLAEFSEVSDETADTTAVEANDPTSLETVDLAVRVRTSADALIPFIGPERLTISSTADEGTARVRARAGRLDRALELVLRRALAGTPHNGGVVRICASVVDGDAIVEVQAPEGTGVPAGWGVRMAMVARIVGMFGGRLALSDSTPSARLSFPLTAG